MKRIAGHPFTEKAVEQADASCGVEYECVTVTADKNGLYVGSIFINSTGHFTGGYQAYLERQIASKLAQSSGRWIPFPYLNSNIGAVKAASKGVFVAGASISAYEGINAGLDGNVAGVGKAAADVSIGGIGLIGGPPGWAAALGYLSLSI